MPVNTPDVIWRQATEDDMDVCSDTGLTQTLQSLTQDTAHLPHSFSSSNSTITLSNEATNAATAKLLSLDSPSQSVLLKKAVGEVFSIGRRPHCDLCLRSVAVSSIHCHLCRIISEGETRWTIQDLSLNGTFLNNNRLKKGESYPLSNGDEISLVCSKRSFSWSSRQVVPQPAIQQHTYIFRDLLLHGLPRQLTSRITSNSSVIYYQKGQAIGKGGNATVYMGMNITTGHLIAVKELSVTADKDVESLDGEIHLLQLLSHPRIVKYLGTDRSQGFSILLEYVPGGSVASLLRKFGAFHECVVRIYCKQILQGLEYLHQCEVVHGDIKGGNILVNVNGSIKLSDFGASFRVSQLQEKKLAGTPLWMAPEVVNTGNISRASDIWSLGCTVIEMATAELPWREKNLTTDLAAIYFIGKATETPEIPSSLSYPAHRYLEELLQVDPLKRSSCSILLQHPYINGDSSDVVNNDHQKLATNGGNSVMVKSPLLQDSESSSACSSFSSISEASFIDEHCSFLKPSADQAAALMSQLAIRSTSNLGAIIPVHADLSRSNTAMTM